MGATLWVATWKTGYGHSPTGLSRFLFLRSSLRTWGWKSTGRANRLRGWGRIRRLLWGRELRENNREKTGCRRTLSSPLGGVANRNTPEKRYASKHRGGLAGKGVRAHAHAESRIWARPGGFCAESSELIEPQDRAAMPSDALPMVESAGFGVQWRTAGCPKTDIRSRIANSAKGWSADLRGRPPGSGCWAAGSRRCAVGIEGWPERIRSRRMGSRGRRGGSKKRSWAGVGSSRLEIG